VLPGYGPVAALAARATDPVTLYEPGAAQSDAGGDGDA
jgi:hypothetical protein